MRTDRNLWVFLILLACCQPPQSRETEAAAALSKEDFHIYLLMGQSNMAGRGVIEAIDTITHPRVLMLEKDKHWVPAKAPIHSDKPIAAPAWGLFLVNEWRKNTRRPPLGWCPVPKAEVPLMIGTRTLYMKAPTHIHTGS